MHLGKVGSYPRAASIWDTKYTCKLWYPAQRSCPTNCIAYCTDCLTGQTCTVSCQSTGFESTYAQSTQLPETQATFRCSAGYCEHLPLLWQQRRSQNGDRHCHIPRPTILREVTAYRLDVPRSFGLQVSLEINLLQLFGSLLPLDSLCLQMIRHL